MKAPYAVLACLRWWIEIGNAKQSRILEGGAVPDTVGLVHQGHADAVSVSANESKKGTNIVVGKTTIKDPPMVRVDRL
jgi:hypothetical protein